MQIKKGLQRVCYSDIEFWKYEAPCELLIHMGLKLDTGNWFSAWRCFDSFSGVADFSG